MGFILFDTVSVIYVSGGHGPVTVQNLTRVYMNSFDHKDLDNHALLHVCPQLMKHPVYISLAESRGRMLSNPTSHSECLVSNLG